MAMNILIVDDSDVIRAMIARTIRLANIELGQIHEASNGREALDVLAEEWVDLVLADINMPVMNGADMLANMHENPHMSDVPVIVVSSEGATERVQELMERGVAAWVRKPFTPEEIRDVILDVTSGWKPVLDESELDGVLGAVLETFAFAFPEPTDVAELEEARGEIMCATITFSGAASGMVSIAAPSELCVGLAANILGIDDADPDALVRGADTLGEIVNIAAGHLATRVEPNAATHLHPPVVTRMEPDEWSRTAALRGARGYVVEEHPVLVTFGLRPAKAS